MGEVIYLAERRPGKALEALTRMTGLGWTQLPPSLKTPPKQRPQQDTRQAPKRHSER